MSRRAWLLGLAACAGAGTALLRARGAGAEPEDATPFRSPPSTGEHRFELDVEADASGAPVNRLLLGQNLQWTDGGDGLLDAAGALRSAFIDKVRALQPAVIRFPGGAQSDQYRWRLGIGAPAARGRNRQSHSGRLQPTLMGTQEFLEICEAVGARPFITVNVVTGTPAEAADWLRLTNVTRLRSRTTGRLLPSVPYWELGNEPYLDEGEPAQRQTTTQFIAQANAFAKALRAVDPSISIGLPLRTDTLGGVPATPKPGFAQAVLRGVVEPVDFIANHNAYLPYLYDPSRMPSDERLHWATMGASATVRRNLDEARELVAQLRPGRELPQAITEYNAMFTLGRGDSDALIASPLGALYVADLLAMLAERNDVLMANYWSLSGNFKFGSISADGFERPGFLVLQAVAQTLQGVRLATRLACERFDAPRAGAVAPQAAVPLVTALATREGRTLRILLLNKDRARPARGVLRTSGAPVAAVATERLLADAPLSSVDRPGAMRRVALPAAHAAHASQTLHAESQRASAPPPSGAGARGDRAAGAAIDVELPRASIALVTLTLGER